MSPDSPRASVPADEVHFKRPPVVETLLGVQFAALPRLTLPMLGLFWGTIRDQYPVSQVQPPLNPAIEEFPPTPTLQVGVEIASEPDARFWFIRDTELIQV